MENLWRESLHQIEIKSANAFYEKLHVLKDIDLNIDKGEIVSLIGPSGSGKSSLLKMLVGLLIPKSGKILLNKSLINFDNQSDLRNIREQIAIVFQQYNLFQNMNVLKNVCIAPTKIQKRNPKEVNEQALYLLEKVGLQDKLKSYPDELSGGQQQRVAIARALVNEPSILFADEPTGNLDSKTGQDVMKIFKDLNENGQTIILITHEDSIAKQSNRIITIMDGLIKSDLRE